jgi:thymidylate synthase (FAD)
VSPCVFLIARPSFNESYEAFLEAFHRSNNVAWRRDGSATEAECLVEFAGRVCYMSFGEKQSPKTNAEYVRNLIESGHESVLEHVSWTFALCGISRAFTHQLVRHRVGFGFSQLSQQYFDESDATFVPPFGIENIPSAKAVWEATVLQSSLAYKTLVKEISPTVADSPESIAERKRLVRNAARSVLPNSTETAIVMTANARALRHFFEVRGSIVGDIEMRCVAAKLLEAVQPEGPALFYGYAVKQYSDGFPIVASG